MDTSTIDDIVLQDEDLNNFLKYDFEKELIAGRSGRKSNSLNDLQLRNSNKSSKSIYKNVESKVKNYIESIPPPRNGTTSQRRTFKKHTSMPGYVSDLRTHSESSVINRLEQEFFDYRRQSDHTITELQKQVDISVAMIAKASNENLDLTHKIARMEKKKLMEDATNPTPECQYSSQPLVCTPKKAIPKNKNRLISNDTAGSFIIDQLAPVTMSRTMAEDDDVVATIVPSPLETPMGTKRNLSFNSSTCEVTRRSGGTDSGINTSDENHVPATVQLQKSPDGTVPRVKRKRVRRFLTSLVCCGVSSRKMPKISYKKM